MRTIKKILAPTDFSESARESIAYAVDLAEKFGASVTLLHAYQTPAYLLPEGSILAGSDLIVDIMNRAADALADARIEVQGKAPKVAIDTLLVEGLPFVQVVNAAADGNYDLIVMGTHGRTGIRHVLLGSVAERVVRRAPCPVLTVRSSRGDVGDREAA